jgi:hypothetical protein
LSNKTNNQQPATSSQWLNQQELENWPLAGGESESSWQHATGNWQGTTHSFG